MNDSKPEKKNISMALTLTTKVKVLGKPQRAKGFYFALAKLLKTYDKEFKDYVFYAEIYDKGYLETCLHFHGTIQVPCSKFHEYNRFVREYQDQTKTTQVESKIIFKEDEWTKYITKQDCIKATYDAIGIKRCIKRSNLSSILKWSKPNCKLRNNHIMNSFNSCQDIGDDDSDSS